MPKLNADEGVAIDPIELTIEGKTYEVRKVTPALMNDVAKIAADGPAAPVRQLALLLQVPEDSPAFAELMGLDVRKLARALTLVTEAITSAIQANPSGAAGKSSP